MIGGLGCKLRTELALASAAAHEQHHAARDFQGERVTVVFFNHRQREINTGGNPGAGPDISILSKDTVAVHGNPWITLRQDISQFPMRGGLASVENAGSGENKSAGAN